MSTPAIWVKENPEIYAIAHDKMLASDARQQKAIQGLEALNAELLEALKELRDDDSMPGRFLPVICTAIAKAEGKE